MNSVVDGAANENFEVKKPSINEVSTSAQPHPKKVVSVHEMEHLTQDESFVDKKPSSKEVSSPGPSAKRPPSVPIVTPNKGKKPKIRAGTITRELFENTHLPPQWLTIHW